MSDIINEEEFIEDTEPILENTDKFPCPSCGGNMHFDPKEQALSCPYCSNKIEIKNNDEAINEYDFDKAEEMASHNWGEETRIIKCDSCGAETVLDVDTVAQFCAFCGSSHIVQKNDTDSIAPESIIPFKIAKTKANELFSKWIKKRFFAPSKLKKEFNIRKINGTYIPFWTYDTNTSSVYTANKGTHYYVNQTRTVNGERKTVRVRKTRWRRVHGVYNEFFDDILINGSKNIDESLVNALEPFHLNELIPYKPEYLSGFLAERYSINLEDGWQDAKEEMKSHIHGGIKRQVNGDEVRILNVNTSYDKVKFKHILLPVWISSYSFKEKAYRFLINGQTGEVQGKYPKSALKITLTVLASILAIFGVYYLISHR